MKLISYFTHALLMFVAPLILTGYKATARQKFTFTLMYGTGLGFSRKAYGFFVVPFGTHTVLMIFLYTILLKKILKDFTWLKAASMALTMIIILLVNDLIIVLPTMKLLHLTIQDIEGFNFPISFLSDFPLMIMYLVGRLKNRRNENTALNTY